MSMAKFKYCSSPGSEDTMYYDIKKLLMNNNIHPRLSFHIILALSEAFSNALIHGNKLNPNRMILINVAINNDEITADIIDEGRGDPTRDEDQGNFNLWRENGRGLMLMETLASSISYCRNADTGGLQVSMKFDRLRYEREEKKVGI
jgi:serine/threonine-protein kinase RsbW